MKDALVELLFMKAVILGFIRFLDYTGIKKIAIKYQSFSILFKREKINNLLIFCVLLFGIICQTNKLSAKSLERHPIGETNESKFGNKLEIITSDLVLMAADRGVSIDEPLYKQAENNVNKDTNGLSLENIGVGSINAQQNNKSTDWKLQITPGIHKSYAYYANHLTVDVVGSGTNGPLSADYGRGVSMIKRGFPSSSAQSGEIDGLFIYLRQAGPTPNNSENASDSGGININIASSGDPGFTVGTEYTVSRIEPDNSQITHDIVLQIGVIDPFGKNGESNHGRYDSINRLTFGYFAGAKTGELDRAFYATNTKDGNWQDFAYFGFPSSPLFRVKGLTGDLKFGPDGSSVTISRDLTRNDLNILNQNDLVITKIMHAGGLWTNGDYFGNSYYVNGIKAIDAERNIMASVNNGVRATKRGLNNETLIQHEITIVESSSDGGGVRLQANVGQRQDIYNRSGEAIFVFPPNGAKIEAEKPDEGVILLDGKSATFVMVSRTQCYRSN